MYYIEIIIKIAALFTAIGIIVGALIKFIKFINTITKKLDDLNSTIVDLKSHSTENYMSLLRLTIMSNEMPIGERINAGYKYLEKGGNGDVKKFLKEEFNITDTINNASHYRKDEHHEKMD